MLHSAGEREKRDARLVWTARCVIHQFQQALRLASASETLPIPFSVAELRSRYQAAIPGGRGGALIDERGFYLSPRRDLETLMVPSEFARHRNIRKVQGYHQSDHQEGYNKHGNLLCLSLCFRFP